jgi:hypothetical protein
MAHKHCWPGALVVAALLAFVLAGTANAAPITDVNPVAVTSSSLDISGYDIDGIDPGTLTVFKLHVEASATWSGSLTTDVGWDSDKVRQGQDVTITRSAPSNTGAMNVKWVLTGTVQPLGIGPVINIGTHTLSKDNVACDPKLSGAGYSCTAESDALTIVETPGLPLSPYVKVALGVKFDITPQGALVTRNFTVGTNPLTQAADLSLLDTPQSETFSMPCNTPVGNSAVYKLDPFDWAPAVAAGQRPRIVIGLMDPIFGVVETPAIVDAPFGPTKSSTPAFDLTGGPDTVNLGALQANNIPPTIDPIGTFSGDEGSPISFSATTASQCPIDSYVWEFSNGTKSFGPNPKRAFKDNGDYDGQLTVTDETGLSATRSFSVVVSNVVPSVNAGPDTTADWGRPVAFNGQATDPGADDQPTLQYTWDFGDGTPSASGGPSVIHSYAAPDDYTATLTVCDKDEDPSSCPSDTRVIHVTKRDTSTGYTGDGSGVFDTPGTLSASLVDEYGQNVNGRTITFTVDSDPSLTASTNSSGIATKSYTPALVEGPYSVLADFAGDSLYNPSSSSHSFDVAKKGSTMGYTGAVTGGPNKTIVLSAVLKDATGKALGGRTVQFQLGTQTASAVTDGTGVASTTLKLNQKNGTYTVSAAWVPGAFAPAGDGMRYTGATDAKVFKLQAK